MVDVNTKIADALLVRAQAIVLTPAMRFALPGVQFEPISEDESYLIITFLPNDTLNISIDDDGASQFRGILQVSVRWPGNAGILKPMAVADKIAQWFSKGLRIDADTGLRVEVTEKPSVGAPLIEGGTVEVPVSVSYQAFY